MILLSRRTQDRGGADPDLSARIDLLEASLRRDLRQFAAAFELLDRAERGFVALNDRNLQARVIINRANVYLVTVAWSTASRASARRRARAAVSASPSLRTTSLSISR
jgi:hypothetical protein